MSMELTRECSRLCARSDNRCWIKQNFLFLYRPVLSLPGYVVLLPMCTTFWRISYILRRLQQHPFADPKDVCLEADSFFLYGNRGVRRIALRHGETD